MKSDFKRYYNFSTYYEKLFDLLTQGYAVVCYVTWVFSHYENGEPMMATDVCEAKYFDEGDKYSHYNVGCRGTMFFTVYNTDENIYNKSLKEIFIEKCNDYELKFIEPKL